MEILCIKGMLLKSRLLQKKSRKNIRKKPYGSIQDLELLPYLDVVVDGKFILEQRDVSLKWKGSANQRVINVKKSLETGSVVLHA